LGLDGGAHVEDAHPVSADGEPVCPYGAYLSVNLRPFDLPTSDVEVHPNALGDGTDDLRLIEGHGIRKKVLKAIVEHGSRSSSSLALSTVINMMPSPEARRELRRIPKRRSSQNSYSTHSGE
jgi:hypothetical protein